MADLSAQFPQYAALIRAYHDHWPDCVCGTIEGSVRILEQAIQNGIKAYGLTNFSSEKFALAREKYPFMEKFDRVIVSGDVKLIKPDPAIYRLTLEQIRHAAQECIFVDDSLPNILAAKEMGFAAIHFQSPAQLEAELGQYL